MYTSDATYMYNARVYVVYVNCHFIHMCSQKTLHEIASHLHLVPPLSQCPSPLDRDLLLALLVARHERRQSQLEELNDTPLYPTEQVLWDENVVPSDYYNGESKDTIRNSRK